MRSERERKGTYMQNIQKDYKHARIHTHTHTNRHERDWITAIQKIQDCEATKDTHCLKIAKESIKEQNITEENRTKHIFNPSISTHKRRKRGREGERERERNQTMSICRQKFQINRLQVFDKPFEEGGNRIKEMNRPMLN